MHWQQKGDIDAFIDHVVRVSHLLAAFPGIKELDLNPARAFTEGSGVMALDARMRVEQVYPATVLRKTSDIR